MYPKKISPSPLVSSTVEIRFKTDKDASSILKSFYRSLSDKLPNLESTSFPKDLRIKNPELKYFPDYILSNDSYSLSFNENFIGFENISEYELWGNYSLFLKSVLEIIFQSDIINTIERIGVRYQSAFDIEDFSTIIKTVPLLKLNDFDENFLSYTTKINSKGFDILLRLKKDVTESGFENSEKQGHVIDIDVFTSENVDPKDVFNEIDLAHSLLKKLFFELLNEDFLKDLNPEY